MCNSCEILVINGVTCHELGCPEKWKDDEDVCRWCGSTFRPERNNQDFCDNECHTIYYGCESLADEA